MNGAESQWQYTNVVFVKNTQSYKITLQYLIINDLVFFINVWKHISKNNQIIFLHLTGLKSCQNTFLNFVSIL